MDFILTWIIIIVFVLAAFGRVFGMILEILRELWDSLGIGK